MNRNTTDHFGHVPKIHQKRSKFDLSHSIKTTWNNGDCIPLYVDADILPGDTVTMDMAEVVRMATPIYPVMDNMVMDLYWFFVPHRLVWDHWRNFWGENDDPWTQTTEYEIPQLNAPEGGWAEGTIADYMGIPTKIDGFSINALPMRAYAKVWSDWFRSENLNSVAHVYTDETTRNGTNGTNGVIDAELGGYPLKGAKISDYYTSALPSPQKGPSVAIPLGTEAPLQTRIPTTQVGFTNYEPYTKITGVGFAQTKITGSEASKAALYNIDNGKLLNQDNDTGTATPVYAELKTDLSNATAATINQLRTAFAIQKYYEAAGRFGTRYIEFLRGVFGVESSDARIQRSEYLGGQRIPINMEQVLQTSSTDAVSPQGNATGFSCTVHSDSMFTKSFEEHGTLMCIALCRVEHSYQQGLAKMWSRKKWTDFYNPYFANLGEQPINNRQIYLQGNSQDEEVFGYQEAWAEYRYKPNIVTGAMRSNATSGSLDAWHYADDYNELPTLTGTWLAEPEENVDRTIAVSSQVANQLIGDFYFKAHYTRCMPVYSVPGLIDHV